MNADITVLLPVHAGVSADELRQCLTSIEGQSLQPEEIVIVEDGPLTREQVSVLDSSTLWGPIVTRLRLAENGGAGIANQAGLLRATGTWIAKADADDILCPERLARQWEAVSVGDVDVLGGAMAEFEDDPNHPTGIRSSPITHEEIASRMRWNSPINHPAAMYRRELAVQVGGYSDLRYMQDYDMFARMLAAGAKMRNLPEVLVLFRATPALFRRRASAAAIRCEFRLQSNLRAYGLISRMRQSVNLIVRIAFRLLPPRLLRIAYRVLFISGQRGRSELP